MQRDLLNNELSLDEDSQTLKNKRTGMFIFQLSWIMAFVCMVVVNWQLSYSKGWLIDDADRVSWLPGTVASVLLLLSVITARQALSEIRADNRGVFQSRWIATLGLGVAFIGIMLYEWFSVTTGTQYTEVFRLMTGFHMFHALVIGLYMLVTLNHARQGHYGSHDFWAVEAGVKLWIFVFVAWMLFYVVLYWVAW